MGDSSLYKRILLKISGESLGLTLGAGTMGAGREKLGIDFEVVARIAEAVLALTRCGVKVCLVVGGGNIFRGRSAGCIDRATGDYMGMLATVMNGLALQNALERQGQATRVLSAIPMQTVCEPYIRRRAARHMEKGRVVICVGGTGNPYVTTDTAAALRAAEMGCEALFKGSHVDGVYSGDPHGTSDVHRYDALTYHEVLTRDLRVMDMSAVTLCRENHIPIIVFSIEEPEILRKIAMGEGRCTVISETSGETCHV